MANLSTSASCVADGRLGVSASASVTQGGQSIDGNYTTVNYSYSASRSGSLGFIGTTRANAGSLVLIINGQTVVNVALPLSYGSNVGDGITSGSGSVRVAHNADGSKKASIELKIVAGSDPRGANYYWGSNSTSGSITLTTIPRASYPTVSASSKTLGETIGISTNRKSGNFTHSLWWICGDSGWQGIASGVGDSYSWTIPRDIANRITSSTSATITIVCRTYSGNTQIGSDQTTSFTGNVPSDIKPSISGLSVSEAVSNVASKFGVYLKGQSKLNVSFNDSGSYGSWITSERIEVNNQTFWSKSAQTDYLYWSGGMSIKATVTDSRGRSTSASTSITVQDYGTPWVNSFRGIRCNSDGSDADDGEYLKFQFSAGVYSVSNKNTASYQLGYRVNNSGSYSYKALDLSSLSYDSTTTGVISGLTFDMYKTYDLVLVVTDKLGKEARRSDVLSTALELINFHPDGTGMAIGKFAESPKLFDVGLDSHFRKNIQLDGILNPNIISPSIQNTGGGNSANYMHIATIKVNTTYVNVPLVIEYLQRGSSGATRLHIRFNSSDGVDPALGLFVYEGRCRGAYLAKASTSTWNLYITKSEAWENIGITDIQQYSPYAITVTKVQNTNISSLPSGGTWAVEMSPFRVKDVNQSDSTTFAYSESGMGLNDMTWLACWDGYKIRKINKNQLEDSGYDSNSGWSWFRSQSGLMIQHKYQTFSKSWKAWGSVYSIDINRQDDGTKEISDYAYKFTQTPTRLVSLADGSSGNAITAFPDTDGLKDPTHNFGGIIITRPNNTSMTYVLSMMAIGWWK